jgi:PAS domain S-box-containing protein
MLDDRKSWFENRGHWLSGLATVAVLLGSCVLSQHNFLLFHTLVEISSFVVVWMVFAIFWNTRRLQDNGFYLFIAIACAVGGVLDLTHALTYQGMSIIPGATADDSIQAKTAGRWIVSMSFLVAPLFLRHKISPFAILTVFGGIFTLVMASIFYWDFLPIGYISGKGMSAFQHFGRGVSCVLFFVAAIILIVRRKDLDRTVCGFLLASLLASIASEFASALSADFKGVLKVFAHLSQLASLYFLYKVFIEWGIKEPSSLLFQNLKRSENDLRKEHDFMDALLQTTYALVVVLDTQGRIVRFNRTCETISGYSAEEIAGEYVCDILLLPDEREEVRSLIEEHSAGLLRSHHENSWINKTGDRRLIAWSNTVITEASGAVKYIVCTGIDITERKQVEQRQVVMIKRMEGLHFLQETLLLPGTLEDKFKIITDTAVDLLDLDLCRIWMVRLGNLCDSGCIHATTSDEKHRCPKHEKCLHLLASSGRYTHLDGDHRRVPLGCYKIGKIATGEVNKYLTNHVTTDPCVHDHEWASSLGLVSFAGYKLLNMRDKPTGVLAMFAKHPLSAEDDAFLENLARKTSKLIIDHYTEEELRQAQKLDGVGQLAGGVAHEFNNLLQVITGFTRYGMKGLDPEEDRYHDYQHVLEAADRATALTRQLLGFSRRKAIQPKCVDANRVVRDLIQILRPTLGKLIIINELLGDDVGMIYADTVDLQQSLLNLCLNARDAMPAGGILTIKTEKTVIDCSCQFSRFEILPGCYVIFSVSDMGCGISPQNQQHIFEPFYSTKEVGQGTGLGLSMVYGMVQQHHGAIQVESEVGQGTCIKLYLPSRTDPNLEESEATNGLNLLEPDSIPLAENIPMTTGLNAGIF